MTKTAILRSPVEQQAVKSDALKQLLQLAATGLGVGVAGRSLLGLKHLAGGDSDVPVGLTSPIPSPLPIPLPRQRTPEEEAIEDAGAASMAKVAAALYKHAASTTGEPSQFAQMANSLLPNISTMRPLGDWWGPAAAIGSVAVPLVGGWALTDYLMGKARSQSLDEDVDEAKREYNDALAAQYAAAMQQKRAEDDLGIDALYEQWLEKQGNLQGVLEWPYRAALGDDNVQGLKGGLLAAMLATGAGSAYVTYNWAKKRNQAKLLEKAMKIRARQQQYAAPMTVYAVPQFSATADAS